MTDQNGRGEYLWVTAKAEGTGGLGAGHFRPRAGMISENPEMQPPCPALPLFLKAPDFQVGEELRREAPRVWACV